MVSRTELILLLESRILVVFDSGMRSCVIVSGMPSCAVNVGLCGILCDMARRQSIVMSIDRRRDGRLVILWNMRSECD